MNRRSIVVPNGNIPVIPSAPSAWNLTPPDTCSFVWAGILQQGSTDSPPHSAHICFCAPLPFQIFSPFQGSDSFYLLLSSVCLLHHFLHISPSSTLTSFTYSNIFAFRNTPKLVFQTTSWHILILRIFSFCTHVIRCACIIFTLSGHIFIHKVFIRQTSPLNLKFVLQRLLYP